MSVRQRALPTRVLTLSAHDDACYIRAMLATGAVGYVLKDEVPEAIIAA